MALFDEPSRKSLPQPTFEDVAHAGRKGLASMIPLVGGAASELLGLLSSPISQRRDDWFEDLARRLHDLEGTVEGFRFDDLAKNEQFVSATLQATQAALRTNQKEKLEALKNAVLHVASGSAPNESRQTAFLALVDRLSPDHLHILERIQYAPSNGLSRGEAGPVKWVQAHITRLRDELPELIRMLIGGLYSAGLSQLRPEDVHMPNDLSKWTTRFGDEFLDFIAPPPSTRK